MSAPAVRIEPVPRTRGYPTAWWGMVVLITTEAMVFLALLSAYFFVRAGAPRWPPPGIAPPELHRSGDLHRRSCSAAASRSSGWSTRCTAATCARSQSSLAIAFVMGARVPRQHRLRLPQHGVRPRATNAYASLFWVIIGLHAIHVLVGLLMSATVQAKVWTGRVTPEHHVTPEVFALYWHFVDGVWIFVFSSLILSPHIGR